MERSTLAARSRKLFTLSAIHSATAALLHGTEVEPEEAAKNSAAYWEEVARYMPEWLSVRDRKMTAGDVRQGFIHSHGIVLHALGRVGNGLLRDDPTGWKKRLKRLEKIDWARSNAKLWEGRAMIGGRICKAGHNVTLTANAIKSKLDLPLSAEEQRIENAFLRGEDVAAAAVQ
jgi:DNA sulfur modification protein DndB